MPAHPMHCTLSTLLAFFSDYRGSKLPCHLSKFPPDYLPVRRNPLPLFTNPMHYFATLQPCDELVVRQQTWRFSKRRTLTPADSIGQSALYPGLGVFRVKSDEYFRHNSRAFAFPYGSVAINQSDAVAESHLFCVGTNEENVLIELWKVLRVSFQNIDGLLSTWCNGKILEILLTNILPGN